MVFTKQLSDTDAQYCLKPTSSNQSSVFLGDSTQVKFEELFGIGFSSATTVGLSLNKKNLALNVLAHFFDQTPWYDRKTGAVLELDKQWIEDRIAELEDFFVEETDRTVSGAGLNKEETGSKRLYIKGLYQLVNGTRKLDLRKYLFSSDVIELSNANADAVRFRVLLPDGPLAKFVKKNLIYSLKESAGVIKPSDARQLITYGAPGTGKSFRTKGETEGKVTFRTTFHPDSDYSTFVGAYKPTMKMRPRVAMVNDGKDAVKAGGDEDLKTVEEITYDFIPQAFVKAYVAAWQNMAAPDENQNVKPVYLVIEEINRGNCAQIFGDLFQLLDRNDDGYSDYPIEADADLARWLKKQFGGGRGATALPADVASGQLLMLPPNLYIRATMNTSDQSLFPIDSAFKRRWDWEYVPIKDVGKGWYVKIGADKYKWWSFLEKINGIVYEETSSADKQMGYFFVKLPEGQQEIDLKKFVNKVAFYLWNDVFKDCEIREDALKLKDANGRPGEPIKFTDFFKPHSNELNEQVVKDLFDGLGVEKDAVEGSEGA